MLRHPTTLAYNMTRASAFLPTRLSCSRNEVKLLKDGFLAVIRTTVVSILHLIAV